MAKLLKIGDTYYSNIDMACNGGDCPTPGKKLPHKHRRRKALSSDKRFAEEKLLGMVKIRNAVKRGDSLRGASWDVFKTRYMDYSATKDPETHYIDKWAFDKLETAIPLITIDSLTPERLEYFKGILQKSGLKITSVNRIIRAIKAAINKAIEWRMIDADPAFKRVKNFKEAKGKLHFWSEGEVALLLKCCHGVWKTIAMLGYYLGLRREEIHTLRVACIDFAGNKVHIEPFGDFTPKDHERRFIPMRQELRDYLKENINGSAYILGDDRPTLDAMTHRFPDFIKEAKLKGSLHTLRHTFASLLAMNGLDAKTLQEYMGHASLSTTERYMHLSTSHKDQEINRLPKAG